MTARVGALVEVEIAALDERGRGVAALDGREVLVAGAYPGERVEARVEALARHAPRAHARVHAVLAASPARRVPPCSRHEQRRRELGDRRPKPSCGGCPLMGLELAAQREAKRRWIERAYGLELDGPIVGGEEFGYRWSSKRVVAGRRGRLRLGSRAAGRRRGDHIADMRGCLVDHPRLQAAFDHLEDVANELGVEPWTPGVVDGGLRYAWAKTDGARVLLTLITGAGAGTGVHVGAGTGVHVGAGTGAGAHAGAGPEAYAGGGAEPDVDPDTDVSTDADAGVGVGTGVDADASPEASAGLMELAARLCAGGRVDGVAHSVQAGTGNAIRGSAITQALVGAEQLSLTLAGVELELGPLGFLQPNPEVAALAYRDLVAGVEPGQLAFDLYAGAGVTTTLLRGRFDEVVPCESYPESAARLGVEPEAAADMLARWRAGGRARPELIVANPPRAGLGEAVCAELTQLGAPRVHLMSCSARTLAADLRRLDAGYELLGLRGYDTLPQTGHLELVAWLRARPGSLSPG